MPGRYLIPTKPAGHHGAAIDNDLFIVYIRIHEIYAPILHLPGD
jgi:hypothetical protein